MPRCSILLAFCCATLISPLAVSATADGTAADRVSLHFPIGIAFAGADLVFSERDAHRIQRLDLNTKTLRVIAGNGSNGFSGDGGPARDAQLGCPDALDIDSKGNLYIADRCNERIRRIDANTGIITTVAGTGKRGPAADGEALEVDLTGVFYLRLVDDDTILFTDTDANRVRELDLRTQRITTLAGNGERGFSGDGGPALQAALARPHIALRLRNGDLLIGDSFNHRLRVVDAKSGLIRTIAGNGESGAAIDGAAALATPFKYFGEIHEQANGDLVFSEWATSQILRLDRHAGTIHVIAGSTRFDRAGPDSEPLKAADIGTVADSVFDTEGRLIVTAASVDLIRRLDFKRQSVETLAGVVQ